MNKPRLEPAAGPRAPLVEIFSAIQGEGLYVGLRQVFVRFAGCNLHCAYCDTPAARRTPPTCAVETRAGSRCYDHWPNPLTPAPVAAAIAALATPDLHRWVSFTGGEPLLHADFLVALLPMVRQGGLRTFLETNGILHKELARLVTEVDCIGMDVKLASATGEPARCDDNRRFLAIARRREVFVKVVVCAHTTAEEVDAVAAIMAAVDPDIPLVLQPVTPNPRAEGAPPALVLVLQETAAARLREVRVIPQTHRLTGQK